MSEPNDIRRDDGLYVEALLQALPYIQRFAGETIVVKFGGHAMGSAELSQRFAQDIVMCRQVGMRVVVVHGGGPQINQLLERLGKEPAFHEGQRITDAETLEVAQMVLKGKVNSDIVAAMNTFGPVAVGISGQDAGLIRAQVRNAELGFVGNVEGVNTTILERLLAAGMIPVVSTIGSDPDGQAYNINADAVAAALAGALGARKLVYLTDVPGLLTDVTDPTSLVRRVTAIDARRMIAEGVITRGMVPKIEGCIAAIGHGVSEVHMLDGRVPHAVLLELFTDAGVGTMLTAG
jgi:acetylglutamate kinase